MWLSLLLLPVNGQAKTLYVDAASGNDATSYADNGPTSPWRTIGRAAWGSTSRSAPIAGQAAQPGDTVIVRAGTYATAGTGDRWGVAYNPANSGTSSARITFEAEGTVQLTLSSSNGPVIGSNARNYITWRGFSINGASAPVRADTGSVVVFDAVGVELDRLTLTGVGNPGHGDNHPGIRLEYARNTVVRNSRISNYYTSGNHGNGLGIQVYYSGPMLFEHNEIYNCGAGIALKATFQYYVDAITIRYNVIRNVVSGVIIHRSPARPEAPSRIYQNIVRDITEGAFRLLGFDLATGPRQAKIVNNTIHGVGHGFFIVYGLVDNAGHMFWNNIVSSTTNYAMYSEGQDATAPNISDPSRFTSQHNLFHAFWRFAGVQDTGHLTFTTWPSVVGHDAASPASRNQDPLFVNAAAADFRLQAGSPARNLGVDVLDLNGNGSTTDLIPAGAYITGNEVIGPTSGTLPPPPTAPSPPTGVRIIQ